MKKELYPILEFDDSTPALINPSDICKKYLIADFPEAIVICFFNEVIEKLLKEGKIKSLLIMNGELPIEFFKFVDCDVALVRGIVGGPACAGILEDAIGLGAKKVIFCGGGGVLAPDITVGKLLVVEAAIRDEGVSYHYLPPSRTVEADPEISTLISNHLHAKGISYLKGKVWTTDAFYRETLAKIQARKEEGALIVEMEQASLLAVAKFRKIKYGAIIYGGDDISGLSWDSRQWRNRHSVREELLLLVKKIILEF